MMAEKTIVLTMYGKDDSVESFLISLFDRNKSYYLASEKTPYIIATLLTPLNLKMANGFTQLE
jgi:hypothetical protein